MFDDIQVGARVKCRHQDREEGIVVRIYAHNPANPIEDHGLVEVKITDPGKSRYLKTGDLEHYVHYLWDEHLEILS